jgi:hypothetical protein
MTGELSTIMPMELQRPCKWLLPYFVWESDPHHK